MHCLPLSFSSLPYSDTGGLSGCFRNRLLLQPASHNNSHNHFFITEFPFSFFCVILAFFVQMVKIQMVLKALFVGLNVRHYFWSRSNLRKEGGKNLKWQIDGHLLAYFSYLFLLWPRSA